MVVPSSSNPAEAGAHFALRLNRVSVILVASDKGASGGFTSYYFSHTIRSSFLLGRLQCLFTEHTYFQYRDHAVSKTVIRVYPAEVRGGVFAYFFSWKKKVGPGAGRAQKKKNNIYF